MLATVPVETAVTVPRRLGLRGYPGVRIRRRDLADQDRVHIDGIWCAAAPLAALETAIALPDGSVFLDWAPQNHVRFAELYQAYCRNMGAYGAPRVGALVAAAADRADSAAERRLTAILRGAGLTGWQRGVPFERWTIDFAFPAARLAIEVDGWACHSDVDRFRADRRKGNALVRAGWNAPADLTWHDLTERPQYVVAEIRAALLAVSAYHGHRSGDFGAFPGGSRPRTRRRHDHVLAAQNSVLARIRPAEGGEPEGERRRSGRSLPARCSSRRGQT